MQLLSADAKLFFWPKGWKNHPQKLLRNTTLYYQTAQKVEFRFQNVA